MKKILKLSLTVLVVCIIMIGNVYAVNSDINMNVPKTTINEGEEITVEIYASNLESELGVIAFGGTLEYDKTKLELVKFEGENDWETPTEGRTYNPTTGKIAIDRKTPGKSDEGIIKITFKAKEKIEGTANISLKDIMLADGGTPVKEALKTVDITIKQNTTIDITPEKPDTTTTPDDTKTDDDKINIPTTDTNQKPAQTTTKPDNTTAKTEQLPQTGDNSTNSDTALIIFAILIILAIAIFGIRMVKVNRKINRM